MTSIQNIRQVHYIRHESFVKRESITCGILDIS